MSKTLSVIMFVMVFLILSIQVYLLYTTFDKNNIAIKEGKETSVVIEIELMDESSFNNKTNPTRGLIVGGSEYAKQVGYLKDFIYNRKKSILYLTDLTIEISKFKSEKEAKSFLIEMKKMGYMNKQIILREEIK